MACDVRAIARARVTQVITWLYIPYTSHITCVKTKRSYFLRRVITKTFYNCKLKIPANAWKYPNNIFHRNNIFQKLKNILIEKIDAKSDTTQENPFRILIGPVYQFPFYCIVYAVRIFIFLDFPDDVFAIARARKTSSSLMAVLGFYP